MNRFDAIIIGAGSGLIIAQEAASRGLKTAVIEKNTFGGTCLNRGCIPSKMLIHTADVIQTIKHAKKLGVDATFHRVRWKDLQQRVWNTIDPAAKDIERANTTNKNITVYKGTATFIGHKKIAVGNKELTAPHIFLCTGTRPSTPPIPGLDKTPYHTSDTIMRLPQQPKKLIILGGGYIGCELAHFFSSIGTDVTIIDRGEKLLKNEDIDIATTFTRCAQQHYHVLLNTSIERVEKKGKHILVHATNKKKIVLTADTLLVATGRTPTTDLLNVKKTGISTNKYGYINVNTYLETSVKGIWAIGDINGKHPFKHAANLEAESAAHNAFSTKKQKVDYTAMPHAIFTSPQIAGVGLTEQELKEKNISYVVAQHRYIQTGMGKALEDTTGFVKILVDKQRRILGCHILGTEASTLIHEVLVALRARLKADAIQNTIHIHPALSEVIQRALAKLS